VGFLYPPPHSTAQNAAEELTKLGGAKVILATVTDAKSIIQ
jgi:hypothetical protein